MYTYTESAITSQDVFQHIFIQTPAPTCHVSQTPDTNTWHKSLRYPLHAFDSSTNLSVHRGLLPAVCDHKWQEEQTLVRCQMQTLEVRVTVSSRCAFGTGVIYVTLHLFHHGAFSKQFEPEVKGNKYLVTGTGKLPLCSGS